MEAHGKILNSAAPVLPRERVKLTERYIQTRPPSAPGKREDHYDSLVPGLSLRVTERGSKTFVLHGRFPRQPEVFTRRALGGYPGLTLDQAREKARAWQALIARGIDPAIEEERQRAAERLVQVNTFGAVAEAFLREGTKGWVKAGEARASIEREYVKRWRDRPVTEIEASDCSAAIKAIAARGAPAQAHNAFGYLRSLFNWAIASGCYGLKSSPLDRLRPKAVVGVARAVRTRVLEDHELRRVWAAAGEMAYPYGSVVRLMILTGQREDMIASMSWREISSSDKLWTIPALRMKGRRAHEVPLCPVSWALLESLPRWNAGDFVFTTTSGAKPINGFSKTKVRIDALMAKDGTALDHWVFHDLRRTMRTHLSALPVQDVVREAVIAHAQKGLHRVYDRHGYRDEKRECLTLWEARLGKIVGRAE